MKISAIVFITLLSSLAYSQVIADYHLLAERSYPRTVTGYVTKNGDTLKIGDTIQIGQPSAVTRFEYITQGGQYGGTQLSGASAVIHKIYVKDFVVNGRPTLVYVTFKGWGLLEVFVAYEQALEVGEVMNKGGALYKREEAIAKLKEMKELLDLGLIDQADYDSTKVKLTPYILN